MKLDIWAISLHIRTRRRRQQAALLRSSCLWEEEEEIVLLFWLQARADGDEGTAGAAAPRLATPVPSALYPETYFNTLQTQTSGLTDVDRCSGRFDFESDYRNVYYFVSSAKQGSSYVLRLKKCHESARPRYK